MITLLAVAGATELQLTPGDPVSEVLALDIDGATVRIGELAVALRVGDPEVRAFEPGVDVALGPQVWGHLRLELGEGKVRLQPLEMAWAAKTSNGPRLPTVEDDPGVVCEDLYEAGTDAHLWCSKTWYKIPGHRERLPSLARCPEVFAERPETWPEATKAAMSAFGDMDWIVTVPPETPMLHVLWIAKALPGAIFRHENLGPKHPMVEWRNCKGTLKDAAQVELYAAQWMGRWIGLNAQVRQRTGR